MITKVPFLKFDVHLAPLMEAVRLLVADGTIKEAVEASLSQGAETNHD